MIEREEKLSKSEEKPMTYLFGRHRVLEVSRRKFGEIFVSLESDISDKKLVNCILKGSWLNTEIKEGDIVNLVNIYSFDSFLTIQIRLFIVTTHSLQKSQNLMEQRA
jgi:hypothetical protein